MKRIFNLFLWIALSTMLFGCISDFTPKESIIELKPGASQIFKATSDDSTAKLVWYLDGRRVAYAVGSYTFKAEQLSGTRIVEHKLLVREEGGRYPMAILPKGYVTSVEWTIRVNPAVITQTCYMDGDGDGYGDPNKATSYQGTPPANCIANKTDCNDASASVRPGATEICGDGIDQDCSGSDLACPVNPNDVDNDGDGVTENQGDCNDANAAVRPGATEACNNVDDNCNGQIDDGIASVATTCGVGACAGNTGTSSCVGGAMVNSCNPLGGASTEICDAVDNDCDGTSDDGISCTCTNGATRSVACGVGACASTGSETCVNGAWSGSTCAPGSPVAEVCDGIDNNCDGSVDNGIASQATTCGVGACAKTGAVACVAGAMVDSCKPGSPATEICNGLDDNCNGQNDDGIAPVATTCGVGACAGNTGTSTCVGGVTVNSCDPLTRASAEVCDGVDNDCDGSADDGVACACTNGQTRSVACGVGACASSGTETCVNGAWSGSTCVAGTATAEVCDSIDNNCDGTVDNGIASQATTCGVGACASTGALACAGGKLVDSCKAGTPTAEICNGLDDNCNSSTDEGVLVTFYRDVDSDTYGSSVVTIQACSAPAGYVANSTDCNDALAAVHPGATETCNTVDDNCNGTVDEGVKLTFYRDADGDTYGAAAASTQACTVPTGYVTNSTDCNDALVAVHPGATETCNTVDDNCNGTVDEGVKLTFYRDADGDTYGAAAASTQACTVPTGYVTNSTDCNDALVAVHPGATETCNTVDDNCNGTVDEGVQLTFYRDADADGYGSASVTTPACTVPAGYVTNSTDCNDALAAVHPGATETCNTVDDNCNGTVDEGVKLTFYRDADSDTYGNAAVTLLACSAPSGYVTNSTDCNDSSASVRPGATETCNNVDDNCNGTVDEGVQITFYRDADADTYGNAGITTQACSAPSGYVANSTDCDDSSATVRPGATETCNNVDDNCNGTVDENVKITYYRDADADGYGTLVTTTQACSAPSGYVANSTDCNDTLAAVRPGATETCNAVDDNCNGTVDENVKITYYRDADADGYGTLATTTQACSAPSGYVANSTDCNDTLAAVRPGATEICNSIDDNCNGQIDASESGVVCATKPATPTNVAASDIASGLTSVNVTWTASTGATYYNVYRATWDQTGTYVQVGTDITTTSFTFTQDWLNDVIVPTGPFIDGDDYVASLEAFRLQALPYILNFKAPAFFKVEACNAQGCSAQSAADAGQAEFIHTKEESEVAHVLVPLWYIPVAKTIGSLPGGSATLSWCGMDICGSGGGMVMSRLNTLASYNIQLDIYFENYIDQWTLHPAAQFKANGYIGGLVSLLSANAIKASGNCATTFSGNVAKMFTYISIALNANGVTEGYTTVTYKGNAYQFTLPVDAALTGLADLRPLPLPAPRTDTPVTRQATAYPVPFMVTPATSCALWDNGLIQQCTRIPSPQPVP